MYAQRTVSPHTMARNANSSRIANQLNACARWDAKQRTHNLAEKSCLVLDRVRGEPQTSLSFSKAPRAEKRLVLAISGRNPESMWGPQWQRSL
jgi:hypothetical protein